MSPARQATAQKSLWKAKTGATHRKLSQGQQNIEGLGTAEAASWRDSPGTDEEESGSRGSIIIITLLFPGRSTTQM